MNGAVAKPDGQNKIRARTVGEKEQKLVRKAAKRVRISNAGRLNGWFRATLAPIEEPTIEIAYTYET